MKERDDKDYAIEFGLYLATEAATFLEYLNRGQGICIDPDRWAGMQSAIYEFRKRANRVVGE